MRFLACGVENEIHFGHFLLIRHTIPDHNEEVKLFHRCVGAGVIGPPCLHPAHSPGISDDWGSGEATPSDEEEQ